MLHTNTMYTTRYRVRLIEHTLVTYFEGCFTHFVAHLTKVDDSILCSCFALVRTKLIGAIVSRDGAKPVRSLFARCGSNSKHLMIRLKIVFYLLSV